MRPIQRFLLGVFGAAVAILIGLIITPKLWSLPPNDIRAGLRGGTIFIVRPWPLDTTIAQIWIQEDGTLTRGVVSFGPRTQSQMSISQVQALQQLREQWCVHPPQQGGHINTDRVYEIGLACHRWADQVSGRSDRDLVIPFEQLPMILQNLVT